MNSQAKISASLRNSRAQILHSGTESLLTRMQILKMNKVPLAYRNNIARSLIDMKRNNALYDFGPNQQLLLGILIKKARNLRTLKDVTNFHKLTCGLGLEKDLAKPNRK